MQTKKLTKKSQCEHLLDYLKGRGHISQGEAELVFGVKRLASRINDLKNRGHAIKPESRKDALGNRYTRYHLISVVGQINL